MNHIVPDPTVITAIHLAANSDIAANGSIACIGNKVTLQCQVYSIKNESVTTDLAWYMERTAPLDRIVSIDSTHGILNFTFQHVREIDSGSYTCNASVYPQNETLYSHVINGTQSSTIMLYMRSWYFYCLLA